MLRRLRRGSKAAQESGGVIQAGGKRTAAELGGTSTDPTGMEVMVGEDEEAYIARQQRNQAEAKARMAAKFAPPATPMNSPRTPVR